MGITLPQASQQATRENVVRMAQNAEKEGFNSLWVFERLLWPINPQTPYPGTPDGSLPTESQNVFDPLETLTYVAAQVLAGLKTNFKCLIFRLRRGERRQMNLFRH